MRWFVKIERGVVDKAVFDRHVAAHKAFVRRLAAEGREARTGHWAELGGGMLLFKAASLDEARAIVAEDPLVKNACVSYELHEWRVVAP